MHSQRIAKIPDFNFKVSENEVYLKRLYNLHLCLTQSITCLCWILIPTVRNYDDLSVTDNGDMPVVLATAFAGIRLFMNSNSGKSVYFEGSTYSRTRLYQMVISKVYDPQNDEFIIYGKKNNIWFSFEPNINYDSFLVVKKS
jgi:hypothetical protein